MKCRVAILIMCLTPCKCFGYMKMLAGHCSYTCLSSIPTSITLRGFHVAHMAYLHLTLSTF